MKSYGNKLTHQENTNNTKYWQYISKFIIIKKDSGLQHHNHVLKLPTKIFLTWETA